MKQCCGGHKQPCNEVWSLGVGVHSAHSALNSSTCILLFNFFFFNRYRKEMSFYKLPPCGRKTAQARQHPPLFFFFFTKLHLKAFARSKNTLLELKSLQARTHGCLQRRGVGVTPAMCDADGVIRQRMESVINR